jgi:hypothetical protein
MSTRIRPFLLAKYVHVFGSSSRGADAALGEIVSMTCIPKLPYIWHGNPVGGGQCRHKAMVMLTSRQ